MAEPEEPDDAGDDENHAPVDLVELHEILEWQNAITEDDGPEVEA
jgi:hypothetical protein